MRLKFFIILMGVMLQWSGTALCVSEKALDRLSQDSKEKQNDKGKPHENAKENEAPWKDHPLPWPRHNVTFPHNGLLNITLGVSSAPVTIYEISSVTCYHCAQFHKNIFPALKEKYIDTGKVHFVVLHCPIDGVSMRAAMVLTQVPQAKRYEALEALWLHQPGWFPEDFSADNLRKMSQTFEKFCALPANEILKFMYDDTLAEQVVKDRLDLEAHLQVDGTPTFVINGDVLMDPVTLENFHKAIQKHLVPKSENTTLQEKENAGHSQESLQSYGQNLVEN